MSNLLVVESLAKAGRIREILDSLGLSGWRVACTFGHFRSLGEMSGKRFDEVVSVSGWRENFVVPSARKEDASRLLLAAREADEVYLATDDDREGEAIAWHVADYCGLDARRLRLRALTSAELLRSLKSPDRLDLKRVDAHRARVIIDYLIGMRVSRMLWRFGVKSAGRLQSCALRSIVDRENAIADFETSDFVTINVAYQAGFFATVCRDADGELGEDRGSSEGSGLGRSDPIRFDDERAARDLLRALEGAVHLVDAVDVSTVSRPAPKPLTTNEVCTISEARFGLGVQRTASVLQQLYEMGCITNPRTDVAEISEGAVRDTRAYIGAHYPRLLSTNPVPHTSVSSEAARFSREAIRPTLMTVNPRREMSAAQELVYDLVFRHTLCSQATPAVFEKTTVCIKPEGIQLRLEATGTRLQQPGWTEIENTIAAASSPLPSLLVDDELKVADCTLGYSKTTPPPHFSEASLVRYLKTCGVGRPSTYAPMLETLKGRGYVTLSDGAPPFLASTPIGRTANELLRLGFPEFTEQTFTASTERALDAIASGRISRSQFLDAFYEHFSCIETEALKRFDNYAASHPEVLRRASGP